MTHPHERIAELGPIHNIRHVRSSSTVICDDVLEQHMVGGL
jgi:hypothetical protein